MQLKSKNVTLEKENSILQTNVKISEVDKKYLSQQNEEPKNNVKVLQDKIDFIGSSTFGKQEAPKQVPNTASNIQENKDTQETKKMHRQRSRDILGDV